MKKEQNLENSTEQALTIPDVIKRLNIRVMYCRSGKGLMSYDYNFLQIDGYAGQSYDDVKREEDWDGDYKKGGVVLDCRKGKCNKISKSELKEIIELELNAL